MERILTGYRPQYDVHDHNTNQIIKLRLSYKDKKFIIKIRISVDRIRSSARILLQTNDLQELYIFTYFSKRACNN